MKNKLIKLLTLFAILCLSLCALTACGSSTESKIEFETLSVNGKSVYGKVSNDTETFSFINEIKVVGNAKYIVSFDIFGSQIITTKTIPLILGDNKVYITEMIDDEPTNVYETIIRRKPMYNVQFNTEGGTEVEIQTVEEDGFATLPAETIEKAGYTFGGWDYDFTTPITESITIDAKWNANTDTPYTAEYYFEKLYGGYEIDSTLTEELTGTTDTTASVTPKTFEHFTFNEQESITSANIDGNGNAVLKLYYTRNYYTVKVSKENDKGTVSGAGSFANVQQVTVSATVNVGYTFDGWYNGDTQVSKEMVYKFNPTENVTLTAKWTADTDTKYTVEYYFENLEDSNYTKDNTLTEELKGATDTTATVTPKTFEHFTFNENESTTSANINSNGSTVLKVYYTRNYYTLSYSGDGYISNAGTYKYGIKITSTAFLGYDVVWKSGDNVLSTESEYAFTVTQNVIAETSVKEDAKIFYFTSTATDCKITGLKDKTQTSITIPNYVTSIGNHAFYDCDSLTSIEIPDSVISIGDYAFAYCNLLTNIEISRSIINIGEDSFIGCSKLTIHCETERKRSGWSNDWNSSRPVVWGTIKVYTVSFSLTSTIRKKDRECVLVNNGSISLGEGQSLEEYSIELLEGETLAEKGITKLPIVDPIEDSGIADGKGGYYSFGGYWKYSNAKNGDTRLYKVEPDTVFNAKNFPGVAEDGVIIILPHCRAHWTPAY